MIKTKEAVITVTTVFAGKQSDRDAFLDLIAHKQEMSKSSQFRIDCTKRSVYNEITPNCGIHSGTEDINEN